MGISPVFAEIISIETDKTSYTHEDSYIIISGEIADRERKSFVAIQVFSPFSDADLGMLTPDVNADNTFSAKFPITNLETTATYTIIAYDQLDDDVKTITFEFTKPVESQFIDTATANSSFPLRELENKVDELENINKELLLENRKLQNQINSLNKRVDDLLLVVTEQIRVLTDLGNQISKLVS